jgi:chemotaxis methyl-accepting protein methylase
MTKKSLSPVLQDLHSILIKELNSSETTNLDQCGKLLDELLEKVDEKFREGAGFEHIKRVVVDLIARKEREVSEP